jgi:hypothetical protein
MTNAPVSPNRKMFHRFKREKIRTNFTELNEDSNVEKIKYLIEPAGERFPGKKVLIFDAYNTAFCVVKTSTVVERTLKCDRLFPLKSLVRVSSYTSDFNILIYRFTHV